MFQLRLLLLLSFLAPAAAAADNLESLDGNSYALGDIVGHGNWVMVNVWSVGCSHCITEVPTLIRFHDGNPSGATIVGVAVDYPGFGLAVTDDLVAFKAAHGINFPVLIADGESASRFLGETVDIVPITFAYHPDGRLVARWHGVISESDLNEIIRDFSAPGP